MRIIVVLLLALAPETAAADPPAAGLRRDGSRPSTAPDDHSDGFLHLDERLRLTVDDLDSRIEHFARTFQIGTRGRIDLESEWRVVDHDTPVRGWRVGVSGSYDLGVAHLVTGVAVDHVDTDLGRDSLVTAGIGLRRTCRLSPKVRGWIGITLGQRRWMGPPPTGEQGSTRIMLSAGMIY
jgi:hypothetical protein